jgi:hypothetical protein
MDEINKISQAASLTDRELLILSIERLTALNEKFDELRTDTATKNEFFQTELNTVRERINKLERRFYLLEGAALLIGSILSILSVCANLYPRL